MKLSVITLLELSLMPAAFAGGSSTVGPAAPAALRCGSLHGSDGAILVGIQNPKLSLYKKTVSAMMQGSFPGAQIAFIPLQKMDVMPQPDGSTKYSFESADREIVFIATVAQVPQNPVYEWVAGEFYYRGAMAECPAALIPVVTGP
jgi:hypothetical protein